MTLLSMLIITKRIESLEMRISTRGGAQASKATPRTSPKRALLGLLLEDYEKVGQVCDRLQAVCNPALAYNRYLNGPKTESDFMARLRLNSLWETFERERDTTLKHGVVKPKDNCWSSNIKLKALSKLKLRSSASYGIPSSLASWPELNGQIPYIPEATVTTFFEKMLKKLLAMEGCVLVQLSKCPGVVVQTSLNRRTKHSVHAANLKEETLGTVVHKDSGIMIRKLVEQANSVFNVMKLLDEAPDIVGAARSAKYLTDALDDE